jgi:hypothetical protein
MLSSFSFAEAKTGKDETQWITDWQQEPEEDGITAQCRQNKNMINQCKFKTVVDNSVLSLSAVILDVENYTSWALNVQTSKRLPPLEPQNDIYVYNVYKFIGAYDRDAVTHYTAEENPETKAVKIKFMSAKKDVPVEDFRLVRFPLVAGYWQFTPLDNGKTEIEHMSFAPPGGVVQSSLYYIYNMSYVMGVRQNIMALKKEADKAQYKTATLNFEQIQLTSIHP